MLDEHMTTLATTAPASVPARHALDWLGQGWRLLWRAPLRLILLSLAPFVAEFLLQLIPGAGIVASKLIVPIVQAGVWVGLDGMFHGRPLRVACLGEGFRRERLAPLAGLSLWFLIVFATQLLVVAAVFGPEVSGALLLGHVHRELAGPAILLVVLPGLVPGTFVMLSTPLVLFDHLGPTRAVARSVRLVLASPAAFALFTLLTGIMLGLALLARAVPLLVLAPWFLTSSYAAYRDLNPG